MKRSPMSRTGILRVASVDKTRKPCRVCKVNPIHRPGAIVCSAQCAEMHTKLVADKAARAKAKATRALELANKEASPPVKKLLKLTEKVINTYVRVRDFYFGCISCDKPSHWDGAWHASHFKSVGSNSKLRFNLWNIHKGCDQCNWFKSGNITEYEKRLTLKIGADRVDWLKCQNGVTVYTAEYLIRLKKVFAKKTRRLLKRMGQS